jgi:hypothetical protein
MRQLILLCALALCACGGGSSLPGDPHMLPLPTVPPGGGAPAGPADAGTPASPDAGTPAVPDAGTPASPDAGPSVSPDARPPAPAGPTLAGCPVFPADSDWNRDVAGDPVDPNSSMWMTHMGAGSKNLHADFGSNPLYGIPVEIVSASQPGQRMQFQYVSQSDPGPYPYPDDVPIQGGQDAGGDRHAVVLDRDHCLLFETYDTHWLGTGSGYFAGSGAIFDLRSSALRPDGWTAATASGLPLLPGLARYDEIASGEIRHALTFTSGTVARAWVHPGTHYGESSDATAPPMAIRVRLKAGFDLSPFKGMARIILAGLQRYGMFLVDEASADFVSISGATDSRWDDHDLDQLKTVPFSAFEVVQSGPVHKG